MNEEQARAIAAQWQSSGTIGWALAAFASGAEVALEDVQDDIDATLRAGAPESGGLNPWLEGELIELREYLSEICEDQVGADQ